MDNKDNFANQIQLFLENIYFDFQSPGGARLFDGTKEEYIIKLITRSIVAFCTAWWSAKELIDYLQNRSKTSKGLNFDESTFP